MITTYSKLFLSFHWDTANGRLCHGAIHTYNVKRIIIQYRDEDNLLIARCSAEAAREHAAKKKKKNPLWL